MVGRKGNLGETTNSAKSFLSSNQFLLVPYLIIREMFVWKEHISISPGVQWCEIRRRSSSRFSKRLRRSMKGKHQPSIFSVSKNHILTCQRICLHFKPEVVGMRWLHACWNWRKVFLLWESVRHLRWVTCWQDDHKQSHEMRSRWRWALSNQIGIM